MSFIFVGGCQRTGTSLLHALLCSDPDANPVIAEAEYLRQMVQPYTYGKRNFDYSLIHYFGDEETFRTFHGAWIHAFLDQVLQRYMPARHLVLKEPHLTQHFPILGELLPEARFIVLVRDPRDTVSSMREVGRRLAAKGSGHLLTKAPLKQLISLFTSFYAACLDCKDEEFLRRLLLLRYEDLVSAPESVLDKLGEFTGLALREVDPAVPWKRTVRPADAPHPRQRPWRTELSGSGVSPASIGRYRTRLKPGEIRAIDRALAGFYSRFGYSADATPE